MRRGIFITLALLLLLLTGPALAQPTCALNVSPASGTAPLRVTASGLCSSTEQNITEVILSWGDGSQTFVSQGFTVSHTYTASGSFNVVVTAIDTNGLTGSATQRVTVSPPLQCSPAATPTSGKAPLKVTVKANCTDSNTISSIVLQFGDGYYQGGPTATHTYVSAGNLKVVVTAKDSAGNAYAGTINLSISSTPAIFVGVNNGQVKEFGKDGTPIATLSTTLGGSTTGMAFDQFANLYVTNFTANAVSKFTRETLAGTFGSGYNCQPESIVFDNAGNAYVGETGCSHAIVKLDPHGTITAVYQPAVEKQGTDWIDLASDQCTIYYTSQGASVLRFNTCIGQQLAPLTSQLSEGLALRILPDTGVVVADLKNILRFDGSGKLLQTYDAVGEDCWSALALDSDGASFWATDYCTSDVFRFKLNTGAVISKFNAGAVPNSVYGIQTFAPPQTTAAGAFLPSPAARSVTPGQAASYSLVFSPVGAAVGQDFTFSCGNLPAGASCTFSPATATAVAGGVTTTLTVNTSTAAAAVLHRRHGGIWFALLLPVLPLLLLERRQKRGLAVVVLSLLLAAALLSCGGSGATSTPGASSANSAPPTPSTGGTAAGAYTVLVHAQSGAQESSTTVQLTVK